MSLLLKQTQVITKIANLLYNFLPGNPHPFADQSISFRGIAYELGLENFWSGGSKLPAIINLLEKTLEFRPEMFYRLMLEIVSRGIKYKANKGAKITKEEIEKLNRLLLEIQFKIPELWNKDFLNSLPFQNKEISEKSEISIKKNKKVKRRTNKFEEEKSPTKRLCI